MASLCFSILIVLAVVTAVSTFSCWPSAGCHREQSSRIRARREKQLQSLEAISNQQSKFVSPASAVIESSPSYPQPVVPPQQQILEAIDEVTHGMRCSSDYSGVDKGHYVYLSTELMARGGLDIPGAAFKRNLTSTTDRVELLVSLLSEYKFGQDGPNLLRASVEELLRLDQRIFRSRLIWFKPMSEQKFNQESLQAKWIGVTERRKPIEEEVDKPVLLESPWLKTFTLTRKRRRARIEQLLRQGSTVMTDRPDNVEPFAEWTAPYYSCILKAWLVSYTGLIVSERQQRSHFEPLGLVSVDIDVTNLDINQCDQADEGQILFRGSHKCHRQTSYCEFTKSFGWRRGGYQCRCKSGFYSASNDVDSDDRIEVFNGTMIELAWDQKVKTGWSVYDLVYTCKPCAEGCHECNDSSPCLSTYNWAFRTSLLIISLICILITALLAFSIYKYRKLKVFKVASPIFLCITLLGCAFMYLEMAAIFPVLDTSYCIITKITRHMGFCITYSALLLKTWRVSLTYRVKSAHKLKLTDNQLLQWLFPILLIMAIYLGTWIISAPPTAVYITDWYGLKFRICEYNWWDHSLVIGEFLFLLWGIKVCFNVRNLDSYFNEAKYITWAIYNITVINIIMIFIHLLILPHGGPDLKYFLGFLRTQLSTTTTVLLIFGPKFCLVVKGKGDLWEQRARPHDIVNATFGLNGPGLVHEDTIDLQQENEELKDEIHKLATQIELMKLLQMEMNNRHLKKKASSNVGCRLSTTGLSLTPEPQLPLATMKITTNPL